MDGFNYTELAVQSSSSLLSALKVIESSGYQIAFVVNEDEQVIGTISDGDIRRHLIKSKTLDSSICDIMNSNFLFLRMPYTVDSLSSLMEKAKSMKLRVLPVLNSENKLIDIIFLEKSLKRADLINSVLIMAGGKGVRLRPLTHDCPKPMLPINGRPMLESIIMDCINSGFKKFYISVNYMREVIMNHFGDGSLWNVNIIYLEEEECRPLGTAGSLGLLPACVNEPLLVMNGDVRTHVKFESVIDFHLDNKADITICAHEYNVDIPYGVIESVDSIYTRMIEKPTYKFLINTGIYVLNPSIFQGLDGLSFVDMPDLIDSSHDKGSVVSVCALQDYWIDIGRPEDYQKAQSDYAKLS